MAPEILIEPSASDVARRLCNIIEETANKTIERDDIFKIGLSGGSLVKFLTEGLPRIQTDWSKWRFFFCDERIVPFDSEQSTYGVYKASLIGQIPVGESQFVTIDPDLSADEAAGDYVKKMCAFFPPNAFPRFDMLLLGMGEDGHTCSLFPDHRLLDETSLWICPLDDSPKPPPRRITLTLPVINNAGACVFAITGAGKADMVKRVWTSNEKLPAGLVRPTNGKLFLILDNEAAEKL